MHVSLPVIGACAVLLLTGCASSSMPNSSPVPAVSSSAASASPQFRGVPSPSASPMSSPAATAPTSPGVVAPKQPGPLAVGPDGRLLISDDAMNEVLSRAPDGSYTVIAGNGTTGFSGDGGPATAAQLNQPAGLAVARDGTVYIADEMNNRVRAVGPDGIIRTVFHGSADVDDVTVTAAGAVYVASTDGLFEISPTMTTVARDSELGGHDPSFGKQAGCEPDAIAADPAADFYISCYNTKSLLKLTSTGGITFRGEFRPHDALAGLTELPTGGIVGCSGDQLLLVSGAIAQPLMSFESDFPGIGPFWPQGIAAAPDGTIYLSQDGASGIGPAAIISLDPAHRVSTLWTESP
jgi:hypothetical protein